MREEAQSDALTGLGNRRSFDKALEVCIGNVADTKPLSLMIADIDHFKQINDTFGHVFGDAVLRGIAQVLKANIKGQDAAARYGGEEFVILLPDTPIVGAHAVAEKIRSTIANGRIRRTNGEAAVGGITISLGVATYCAGETAGEFISRADKALYLSKTDGRNRVTLATGPSSTKSS